MLLMEIGESQEKKPFSEHHPSKILVRERAKLANGLGQTPAV